MQSIPINLAISTRTCSTPFFSPISLYSARTSPFNFAFAFRNSPFSFFINSNAILSSMRFLVLGSSPLNSFRLGSSAHSISSIASSLTSSETSRPTFVAQTSSDGGTILFASICSFGVFSALSSYKHFVSYSSY